MEIPKNISKEHLLKAIEKIDVEGIPDGADSKYYDVVYNGKKYPPKLIVSYSNLFANNEVLDRSSFNGGIDTQAFELLRSNGFTIINKENNLFDKLKSFSNFYKSEVRSPHSRELKSYDLLVNRIPEDIRDILLPLNQSLIIKGSIGKGSNTNYPWIGIFDPRVSSGATNGFYVVLLFSDDFEDLYITLNQGSTLQTQDQIEAYRRFVFSYYTSIQNFLKGELPPGSLVKRQIGATANGLKYEKTNIFYRKYNVASIEEDDFLHNLKEIVRIYIDLANKYHHSDKSNGIELNISPTTYKMFNESEFRNALKQANLFFNDSLVIRYLSSLLTKPFVILTGLTGSGKSKLAYAFASWLCENEKQYCIIPVGADWTNREPLLGFPNALDSGRYILPENGVLELLLEANKPENENKPYFLILDEMNLSHVERYFADFLSTMESSEPIPLHTGSIDWKDSIPSKVKLPLNLFIIGTVNIDETTYMFSPKVLDRANVIEFRITDTEIEAFLSSNKLLNLDSIKSAGSHFSKNFLQLAKNRNIKLEELDKLKEYLLTFFNHLKQIGAEFGYRTASEILRLATKVKELDPSWTIEEIMDAAIMQKLLPKVHGSRRKLEPVLKTLGSLCLIDGVSLEEIWSQKAQIVALDPSKVKFPISFEKMSRMYKGLIENGFTSYAEA